MLALCTQVCEIGTTLFYLFSHFLFQFDLINKEHIGIKYVTY